MRLHTGTVAAVAFQVGLGIIDIAEEADFCVAVSNQGFGDVVFCPVAFD